MSDPKRGNSRKRRHPSTKRSNPSHIRKKKKTKLEENHYNQCNDLSAMEKRKKRQLEAIYFQVEPLEDVDCTISLKTIFGDDNAMTIHIELSSNLEDKQINANILPFTVQNTLRDENENLLSHNDDFGKYRHLKRDSYELTTEVDASNGYDSPSTGIDATSPDDMEVSSEIFNKKEFRDHTIDDQCEGENDNSFCSNDVPSTLYTGQLLWVQYGKFPYWPAIALRSDATKNEVVVKFFANKGSYGSVKQQNVFEFRGMDSYLKYRKEMQRKHSKNDFRKIFKTATKGPWIMAVKEATFMLAIELDKRLAYFDIIVICSLLSKENPKKKLGSLSELIEKHSSHLESVKNIFEDIPNVFDYVKHELEMALTEHEHACEAKRQSRRSKPIKSERKPSEQHLQSNPSNLPNTRKSVRVRTIPSIEPTVSQINIDQVRSEKTTAERQQKNNQAKRKKEKRTKFERDLKQYTNIPRQADILFQKLTTRQICKICLSLDEYDLVKCDGSCHEYIHQRCGRSTENSAIVKCLECDDSLCYSCKKPCSESKVSCSMSSCGRNYHPECLKDFPQTKKGKSNQVICPSHVCHTCISDDPKNKHVETVDSQLTRCIKCPTTFHIDSNCIPAGVKLLTKTQHICMRHRKESRKPVNLSWCSICGINGGTLLCCDSCPLASHPECLNVPCDSERYYCDGCETCRHPLYGEIVWAKYSTYPFWPAVVVPPNFIPTAVYGHRKEVHDICVRFFGTYDFGWVGRSFIYMYELGDAPKSYKRGNFSLALKQAEKWCKLLADNVRTIREQIPLPYLSITDIVAVSPAILVNKGSQFEPCFCSPNDPDPCGPSSNCVNRVCHIECEACPCGPLCNNQSFQSRKYASFKVERVGNKGFGLIAEECIVEGSLIAEYVGELVTKDEYRYRLATKQTQNVYFMEYDKNFYIDAERKGNEARFINHSCNPNCQPMKWNVEGIDRIGLFAMHDIKKGTELTFNYGFDDKSHTCFCGEKNCSGVIGGT